MKHLIAFETSEETKKRLLEAIEKGYNVYNIQPLNLKEQSLKNAVKNMMISVHEVPVRVEDEVYLICGKNTIREEHVAVSILHKRFAECIKLFVVREDNHEVEIPHELRCFLEEEERDSVYAGSNFSGGCSSGCSGNCSSC